jgi:eukaryotic-like serine/threonine-protein kinase
MLAGRLPFDFSKASEKGAQELEKVLAQEPEKPSIAARRAAGSPRLSKAQWDDLDALCLKAMHRDVQGRYSSVDALIQDIDRYLKSEPLTAGPDTRRYRLNRFLRRNRVAAFATSLVFLMVVGLVAFYTVRLTRERNRAQEAAARSQRIEEFLENLFQGGDDEVGPPTDLRVVTLLDKGVKDTQALTADPKAQADLYQTLGTVYESLGQLDRADSLLKSALDLQRSIYGPDHEHVADTLLRTAILRQDQGQLGESEKLIREALAMDQRHLPPDDPAVLTGTILLGRIMEQRGAYDQAIATLNEAMRLVSGKAASKKEFSACLALLANAYFYKGDYPHADSLNRQALGTDLQLYGEHHPDLADDYINLGQIQTQWGHYPDAEKYFRKALDIDLSWFGKDNPATADVATYVAQSLQFQGREAEAETLLKQALSTLEGAYKEPNPRVALALGEIGKVAQELGNLDEAEADFKREVEIYRSVDGDEHQNTAIALSNLATVYSKRKQYARAEAAFRDILQRFGRVLPADNLNVGITRIKLGDALTGEQRYQDAEVELLAGYGILAKQTSSQISWLKAAREDLVTVYGALKQPDKAARFRAELAAQK